MSGHSTQTGQIAGPASLFESATIHEYNCVVDGAGVAELADARDSKSRGPQGPCGFDSHPRHQIPIHAKPLSDDKNLLAYVVGLALGDGTLSRSLRTFRLRITCDKKYPNLVRRIQSAIQALLPANKVSLVQRSDGHIDVSCYSNRWEDLLGWKAGAGSKIVQRARVPQWIKEDRETTIHCLRGLIETDGSVYVDRGYPMIMFISASHELAEDFAEMVQSIGFNGRSYTIRNNAYYDPFSFVHHVRVAKRARDFLALVNPDKS